MLIFVLVIIIFKKTPLQVFYRNTYDNTYYNFAPDRFCIT